MKTHVITRNCLLVLAFAGCSAGGGATMSGSCDEDSKGFSDCAGERCQPGQYCGRRLGAQQICENGCLSDTNCACGQSCNSAGGGVGSCSLSNPTPTSANCVAAPDQKNYPGGVCCPSGAPSGCIAVPAADSLCASVGLPPKAYKCGGGGTTGGSCCLNMAYYSCETSEAFDLCVGFDMEACLAKCKTGDVPDFQCTDNCFELADQAKHDPSKCRRDPSKDGSDACKSKAVTMTMGCTNVGTRACQRVTDCGGSSHCAGGLCYPDKAGSKCERVTDCGPSAHCAQGCCYPDRSGSPCERVTDCGPNSSCVGGKCN